MEDAPVSWRVLLTIQKAASEILLVEPLVHQHERAGQVVKPILATEKVAEEPLLGLLLSVGIRSFQPR